MEELVLPEIDSEKLKKEVDELFSNEEKKKLYIEILTTSVQEANALTNLVALLVEFPEIVHDPESRRKMHETLESHRLQMVELNEKIKHLK